MDALVFDGHIFGEAVAHTQAEHGSREAFDTNGGGRLVLIGIEPLLGGSRRIACPRASFIVLNVSHRAADLPALLAKDFLVFDSVAMDVQQLQSGAAYLEDLENLHEHSRCVLVPACTIRNKERSCFALFVGEQSSVVHGRVREIGTKELPFHRLDEDG